MVKSLPEGVRWHEVMHLLAEISFAASEGIHMYIT
jgi:hypothetical protein